MIVLLKIEKQGDIFIISIIWFLIMKTDVDVHIPFYHVAIKFNRLKFISPSFKYVAISQ